MQFIEVTWSKHSRKMVVNVDAIESFTDYEINFKSSTMPVNETKEQIMKKITEPFTKGTHR